MTATPDFWLLAYALLATGACVVLVAWLREERRQNRDLAALKARDWPEVERLMEFGGKTSVRSNDYCARFERARDEAEIAP